MLQSMTGFGKSVKANNKTKIVVEVKSLNSKQLDLAIRLPHHYNAMELQLRQMVAAQLLRGKVDLFMSVERIDGSSGVSFNMALLDTYKRHIDEMSSRLGIAPPTDWYATLLRLPDVLCNDNDNEELTDDEQQLAQDAVGDALTKLIAFRNQEGARLQAFFGEKIDAIARLLEQVPQYEHVRIDKVRTRITDALAKIQEIDYDKNRLEQELIFYIEKLDITEEKVRLQNHLNYFIETMGGESGQGKKLGFIAQEMGREINTLGSKANHAELQNLVVKMKDQLEQIKEQVLNVL